MIDVGKRRKPGRGSDTYPNLMIGVRPILRSVEFGVSDIEARLPSDVIELKNLINQAQAVGAPDATQAMPVVSDAVTTTMRLSPIPSSHANSH